MIEGKRGTCYALAIALDKGAKLSTNAREHLRLAVSGPKDEEHDALLGSRLTTRDRLFEQEVGCSQVDGPIAITLETSSEDLGQGPVEVVVHTWPIDEAALVERATAHATAVQEDTARHEAGIRKRCKACLRKLDTCRDERGASCVSDYNRCLSDSHVTLTECSD